ncbi:MAG: hypothetical protein U0W40_03620 [Acidimicrobiia bacterium]
MKYRAGFLGVVVCVMAFAGTTGVAGAADTTTTTTTASADASAPSTVEQLFVQTAGGGTLKSVKGEAGTYTLTLQNVPATVTTFTDRPMRVRSDEATADFVGLWDGGSFADSPPNAALVIDDAPDSSDTFVFTLTAPKYDAKAKQLRYTATIVTDSPTGRLAEFADAVDQNPPTKFGRASLFVDALPLTQMTVTISGVPANSVGGYIVAGFTDTFETTVVQGDVPTIVSAANGEMIATAQTQDGTATVKLVVNFCVNPGQATAGVSLSGSPAGTTVAFDFGTGTVQTLTADGTLNVPSSFQLQGCGQ